MNALEGRQQTTRGIWLAKSSKIPSPVTLIMDLEGSDGRERGEDDTSFERQSALFALAISDILLVNMWAKDVGREAGAGKPLLRTIFQVNLKLFQPSPKRHKTILLFVFRDRTKTPLDKLIATWENDLDKIWEGVTKPPGAEDAAFSDYFEVKYAALSNFEEHPEEFAAEAVMLRKKFVEDGDPDESYIRITDNKLPGHTLALSMAKVWEVVRSHKDLNLPAHRVMVSEIRCKEIEQEVIDALEAGALTSNWQSDVVSWPELKRLAAKDSLECFGAKAGTLRDACLSKYDEEALYFDHAVSAAKRAELSSHIDALMLPLYSVQLAIVSAYALETFILHMQLDPGPGETFVGRVDKYIGEAVEQFVEGTADVAIPGAEYDDVTHKAKAQLIEELKAHSNHVKEERAAHALSACEKTAKTALSPAAVSLFETPPADLWQRLSSILEQQLSRSKSQLSGLLEGYGLGAEELGMLEDQLESSIRTQLMSHAHEAANTALSRVKDRFNETFQRDESGMPRSWTPSVDVGAVAATARKAGASLLSNLCFARLDGKRTAQPSEGMVESALLAVAGGESSTQVSLDLLTVAEWPRVEKEDVLLTPAQARSIWRQFVSDSALSVQQALATQEATRAARNRAPPMWAIFAMIVLGFNEAMAVLKNPLLLLMLAVLFLFSKTVYEELEVENEMSRGLLPGTLALSAKFWPVVRRVAQKSIESAKHFLQDGPSSAAEKDLSSSAGSSSISNNRICKDAQDNDGLRSRRPGKSLEMTSMAGGSSKDD